MEIDMPYIALADQNYYLRQGDLDGACGPYATIMALLALGAIDREELDASVYGTLDGRERLGKLFNFFNRYSRGFFNGGTKLKNLREAISRTYGKLVEVNLHENERLDEKLECIERAIDNGQALVLPLSWSVDSGHFVACIGMERKRETDDEIVNLFLLDPGYGPGLSRHPCRGRYNATLKIERREVRRVCRHQGLTGEEKSCRLGHALISLALR